MHEAEEVAAAVVLCVVVVLLVLFTFKISFKDALQNPLLISKVILKIPIN